MMMHLPRAKPSGSTIAILRRVAGLFRPFKRRFGLLVVLIVLTSTLDLLPALVIAQMANLAADGGSFHDLTWWFVVAASLYGASGVLDIARSYTNQVIGQGVMVNLRQGLFDHLQRLSLRFFTSTRTGEIMSRVTTDVNAVQQAVTGTFTDFLGNVTTLSVALGLMFALEWRLALLAVIVLPLWTYPTIRVGNIQRKLMGAWQAEAAEMAAHLDETLSVSGAMLVKSFGRQTYEAQRFDRSNQELRALSIRRLMAARWFNMATGLFGSLSVLVVFWLGGWAVLQGDMEIGSVVAFSLIIQRVFGPFRQIAQINTTVLSSLAVFERIFAYMDLPVDVDERPGAIQLGRAEGRVVFDCVSFAYNETSDLALADVSFEVRRGEMVALVGPSGAGKTTVTYLLQRFYDPTSGTVTLDGHDLRNLSLDSVSGAVGAVMQDTFLFHTSLAANVRYGRLDASDAEIEAAARAAGLGPLIDDLPRGMETVVGERGYQLSGGERQRVAIARAILKDPPILILDEATSALDSRLEREIREAMERLAAGRTTLVIAHRLSTVVAADQILVFDHGRIVERGRHSELLACEGLYATLYREQFSHETEPVAAP